MKRLLLFFLAFAVLLLGAGAAVRWWKTRAVAPPMTMPATAPDAPASQTSEATPRGPVAVDARRQQLIGVRTVAAKKTTMTPTIRAAGSVRAPETKVADVNVKLDGWIRELFVDYTGQPVAKGQPLFTIYSPELLATEREYVLALKARDQLQQSQVPDAKDRADQIVAAARQRLALWDLTDEQLRTLDEGRQPSSTVTFRSPVAGIVMEKTAVNGMHVAAGQTLYKISDLSTVWVEADVYETELSAVRVGAPATVTFDAYPGERFTGRVAYIYPYLDEATRTNKVRCELANRGGRLKPGMFANVELTAPGGAAIVIPLNALLDSGREQIVFVSQGDGYFDPRKVKAGRRLGDDVQIVDGIKEGDVVATGAAFFLDSESQLRAAVQGYEAPKGASASPPAAAQLDIALRTTPDPPQAGDNQMEVTVKDASGRPVDGADVAVQFFMPAMPTMSMPSMKSEAKLAAAGRGVYRGPGQVLMAGQWQVTVTVTRAGQRLGSRQMQVVSR
jgi:Cu(I)/Ag(I) efflux system membrane fusion protein/cobalt-zinc-cadmium efflux system membrane fusion protein